MELFLTYIHQLGEGASVQYVPGQFISNAYKLIKEHCQTYSLNGLGQSLYIYIYIYIFVIDNLIVWREEI